MTWQFGTDPAYAEQMDWARRFVDEEVLPLETLGLGHAEFIRAARPLQQTVREHRLWALHADQEAGGSPQVRLALLNEILGRSELAPFVFGCQAPDTGNGELLALAGTVEQKERWLRPLTATEILSAFAMTEPGAGSDPRQLTTLAERVNGQWVINGHKWFISNANRADFHIVLAVTDPSAQPAGRFSLIIVPTSTPGIEMRVIPVMEAPTGEGTAFNHCEVWYRDVRVPLDALLGNEGNGYGLAQRRLGPGRIHHCMRWLGAGRRAFDMLCERAVSRSVYGGLLRDHQTIQNWIADSVVELEAARLLTLQAAWKIDQYGVTAARDDIAMIKYWGARVLLDVIDRAIQAHGALGLSGDMPLERMYRTARAARIYDGPDEVHRSTVARNVLRGYTPVDVPTEHTPTRRAGALARIQAMDSLADSD